MKQIQTILILIGMTVFFLFFLWISLKIRKAEFNRFIEEKGKSFEERVASTLENSDRSSKVLNNLYIPSYRGHYTEIDVLSISKTGIYVVECKSYTGKIWGDCLEKYWIHKYHWWFIFWRKRQFYNPCKQNEGHIKWLQKLIGKNYPIKSLIVFDNTSRLKEIIIPQNQERELWVGNESELKDLIRQYVKNSSEYLSDYQIDSLYSRLKAYQDKVGSKKKKHKEEMEFYE